jgi:hypothetical protein
MNKALNTSSTQAEPFLIHRVIHFPTLGRSGDDLSTGGEIKEGATLSVKDYTARARDRGLNMHLFTRCAGSISMQ